MNSNLVLFINNRGKNENNSDKIDVFEQNMKKTSELFNKIRQILINSNDLSKKKDSKNDKKIKKTKKDEK